MPKKTAWEMDIRQTDRHLDFMTDPAQRAESVKIPGKTKGKRKKKKNNKFQENKEEEEEKKHAKI